MPQPSVDTLRSQLRERGYLSHGIERWFALDPWSSRAFWTELAVVALKAATLIAAFAALPHVAIMLLRNGRLGAIETLSLFLLYAAFWLVASFAFVVMVALLMKLRPEIAVDTPRALLAISIAAAGLLVVPIAVWWFRFDSLPTAAELAVGGALIGLSFIVSAIVVSAALLSFSIYELHRIPVIHQQSRALPFAAGAALLVALMFLPARSSSPAVPPQQIVITPSATRAALVAVDGLTWEIFESRPDLVGLFGARFPATPVGGASAAERWASIGTGVGPELHGVRALAGVRLAGSTRVLQNVSAADAMLRLVAPAVGLAQLQPLPPTVRRRHFVWESFADRSVPIVAVNWWTSGSEKSGALTTIGQETIFASSSGDPLRLDEGALSRLRAAIGGEPDGGGRAPRFATVYLPALDVILNRVSYDRSTRLARSVQAIDGVASTVRWLTSQDYEVLLVGMPGEAQNGRAVIASTLPLRQPSSAWDVAPTLVSLFGFPASEEMPGRTLAGGGTPQRIATYGDRARRDPATKLNQEYFESLKSLGYIR